VYDTPESIEKKRRQRRSLRAYANMNKPINAETAALIDRFPSDEEDSAMETAKGNAT
jgi:hypothetical protein